MNNLDAEIAKVRADLEAYFAAVDVFSANIAQAAKVLREGADSLLAAVSGLAE